MMKIYCLILFILPALLFSQEPNRKNKEKEKLSKARLQAEQQAAEEKAWMELKNRQLQSSQNKARLEHLLERAGQLEREKKIHYSQYYETQKMFQDLLRQNPELYEQMGDKGLDLLLYQDKSEMEIMLLKDSNALEARSRELAAEYKSARGKKKKELEDKINQIVSKQFDVREALKKQEIRRLEERINELQDTLQERKAHKKEIVRRRVDDLLGKRGLFDWE